MAGPLPGGGIFGLRELLAEHGEAVEADLARFYGERLSNLGRSLSWRRLGVLLRQLPADAALWRSMHGDAATWQATDHLLAALIDRVGLLLWQGGGGKGSKPKPVPRPGERVSAAKSRMAPREMARRLKAQQERTRRRHVG